MEGWLLGAALIDGASEGIDDGCPGGLMDGWPLRTVLMDGKSDGIKEGGFVKVGKWLVWPLSCDYSCD